MRPCNKGRAYTEVSLDQERTMDPYRRYGRWLKRAAIFLILYVAIGYLFIGVSPSQALLHPGDTLDEYRGLVIYLIFIMSFVVLQFVAMFWFLARGNDYVIYPNEYDTSFDDVRGQPAAVESTKEVLRVFEGFKDFKQMGGYPPHGILFEGPPGTGKTLMAKAVAGASGVPFLFATGSGFSNMFLGIGNMKVRRLFRRARNMSDKYGGAVIFIDELDAVGSRGGVSDRSVPDRATDRIIMGGMGMGGGMGVINELLVQLDGFTVPRGMWRHVRRIVFRAKPKVPYYNILIIGATNRAAALDPALVRPGRFDRVVHVGLPDAEGREDILRYYLAKVRHEPIDYAKLARMTVGYSPAMLKNIVNEALLFALQDGRDALTWPDLWSAKLTEEIGLKQPVKYMQREKDMVATHEAAHAVASYSLERGELQIQVISIQKRESALGLVSTQQIEEMFLRTQKQMIARIQVSLAGLVAEEIWYGQSTSGPSSDLVNATRTAAAYVGLFGMGRTLSSVAAAGPSPFGDVDPIGRVLSDKARLEEIDALLNDCKDRVRNLLLKKRHVVDGIRAALLEREELIGDEIEALMAELGEREPMEIPVGAPVGVAGNGGVAAPGSAQGDGQGGNGQRSPTPPPPPS
jgi:cell division protease FtsH